MSCTIATMVDMKASEQTTNNIYSLGGELGLIYKYKAIE